MARQSIGSLERDLFRSEVSGYHWRQFSTHGSRFCSTILRLLSYCSEACAWRKLANNSGVVVKQSEYVKFDAIGLARLVNRREVSPSELLDAAIERFSDVNPTINAVIYTNTVEAYTVARSQPLGGPLSGVPFLVKDYAAHVKGWATTAGSRLFIDNVAVDDSPMIAAYRRAGLVIFGKTKPCLSLAWMPRLSPSCTARHLIHGMQG